MKVPIGMTIDSYEVPTTTYFPPAAVMAPPENPNTVLKPTPAKKPEGEGEGEGEAKNGEGNGEKNGGEAEADKKPGLNAADGGDKTSA